MELYLTALLIALLVLVVKMTIDMYSILTIVRKNVGVLSKSNDTDLMYQFIKGLY